MAHWFRSTALISLVAPILVLMLLLARGHGKSAEQPSLDKTARETAEPAPVEVRFTDDSVLKLSLRDKVIRLNTRYGKLCIPVNDIRYIDFATRIPDAVARRIEIAVDSLGSPQYRIREAAGAELLELREKAYPALLQAAQHKDVEIVRRAEELLKRLRELVPQDQLEFRKDDMIRTADSRLTGQIEGEAIKAFTYQFGEVGLKPVHVRSLQFLGVAPDPGNLNALRDLVGKSFRFQVTGAVKGQIFGTGIYTSESPLATAAVHAGILKAGQTGVVRVTIVAPPAGFGASAQNGVTSTAYGPFRGAYQVGR
jgi:hypothetical protein